MENWRRQAGGYDEAMILVAVVSITSERLLRQELPGQLQDLAQPLPAERLGDCNISSIAAATGLNRETARRKITGLVEAGFLERVGTRVRVREGVLQEASVFELIRSQLEAFARTNDSLLRDGILEVTRRSKSPRES
jgi:hypothetical protein